MVRMPYERANACAYASATSLEAPYGEIGLGSERSLTRGFASAISGPPVGGEYDAPDSGLPT
jgi:hypothetical protein